MWKGGEQDTKNRGKKKAEAKEKEEEKTEGEEMPNWAWMEWGFFLKKGSKKAMIFLDFSLSQAYICWA